MIPGVNLTDFIVHAGIFAVAAIIFAESGLLVGFFLPGDSLLFATGLLINSGHVHFPVLLAMLIFFIAAVAGDSVGYAFGNKAGPRIFNKPDARLFRKEYIERAQEFYDKQGGRAIILARFIPVVRTFAPIVAGASSMKYRSFIVFNLIGAALWTIGVTGIGYLLGRTFEQMGIKIDSIILPLVLLIVVISILPPAIHILRDKKRRTSIARGIRTRLAILFGKSK